MSRSRRRLSWPPVFLPDPRAVPKNRGVGLHAQCAQIADQTTLRRGISAVDTAQGPGRGAQYFGKITILLPKQGPLLLQLALHLLTIGPETKLAVCHLGKSVQVPAALPEILGKVLLRESAPGAYGLFRI